VACAAAFASSSASLFLDQGIGLVVIPKKNSQFCELHGDIF
jgi:hypothetical protein